MESTSYISKISYDIEKWIYEGLSRDNIKSNINVLKSSGEFPKHLEYIDGYLDDIFGSSGSAFLNTVTNNVIVGFAGTNELNGKNELTKDIITDIIGIGVLGLDSSGIYMKSANDFISSLKDRGYNIVKTTGHSLGGAISVYAGTNNDINSIVTYNGAPLYIGNYYVGDKSVFNDYKGSVIRFVSDNDWLNNLSKKIGGYYIGEEVVIYNDAGHDIEPFFNSAEQKIIKNTLRSNSIKNSKKKALPVISYMKNDKSKNYETAYKQNDIHNIIAIILKDAYDK